MRVRFAAMIAPRAPAFVLALALLAPGIGPCTVEAQVELTDCEQSLAGKVALSTDLDCSISPYAAIFTGSGQLELNGFSLTGAPVECMESCTIIGPGTFAGVQVPLNPAENQKTRVENATVMGSIIGNRAVLVSDSMVAGSVRVITLLSGRKDKAHVERSTIDGGNVRAWRVFVRDSSIFGSSGFGISGVNVKVESSTIHDHALDGIRGFFGESYPNNDAGAVSIRASNVYGNGGYGVRGGRKVSLKQAVVEYNALAGVHAEAHIRPATAPERIVGAVRTRNSSINFNAIGIEGISTIVNESDVGGNAKGGVLGVKKLGIKNFSVVTGNATDADCGLTFGCPDLVSTSKPAVSADASCGTSSIFNTGNDPELQPLAPGLENWGVCSGD